MNLRRMPTAAWLVIVLLVGLSAGYGSATWRTRTEVAVSPPHAKTSTAVSGSKPSGDRKVLYWYDPMYPQHRFDQPGKSPFMDMPLVAKYADDSNADGVHIDPTLSQNLGMRVGTVERRTVATDVTAVATVGFNERDVAVVQARAGGFVERVYARAPGDLIAAGAPLVDVLVSDWAGAQEEYLAVKATGEADLAAAARQRMLLLGMTEAQIARLEQTGMAHPMMTITSPIAGVIQELGVRAGMSISSGMTILRVNGLRTVWLEAAVPEVNAGLLTAGRKVEAVFTAFPGEHFEGRISAILPEANVQTRTLRVRMEFPNAQLRLKPGMFAQVRIGGEKRDLLVVPAEAVIRTGTRAVVFVSDAPGRFHPTAVEVGQEMDGQLVVLGGLKAGQQIALSGQFLIDSEASMRGVVERGKSIPPTPETKADPPTHEGSGTITALSKGQVILSHGPIPTMQWGPMTMPFKLPRPDAARDLQPGDQVRFRFREADGDFVIESIDKTGARP